MPKAIPQTIQLTWTNEYKIDGQKLRGITKTSSGDKLYTVYTFHNEKEKRYYQTQSLVGYQFMAQGELVQPNPPAHNYAFQMTSYLKSKGALGVYEVSSWRLITVKNSIQALLAQQRFIVKTYIEQHFPPSLVAEAQALLIGFQDDMDEDMQRAYQRLGITHLFAISGLHVALVSLLFYEGLLRLHVRREIATIVLIIILPIYGVMAGGAPSVWRSVSVVELVLLARFFKWRVAVDDALAISFIGFVLVEPGVIFQVGFQLSYLATASLIYSSQILSNAHHWLLKSFLMTFVCQLLVYPLLLWHFYEISISSFVVNIVFVPLFSFIILPINIVLLLVSFISNGAAHWLFVVYEPMRIWLTECILFLQALPFQMWSPGRPSGWLIVAAYVSVLVVFYLLEQRKYLQWCIMIFILPALCIHIVPSLHSDLRVTFLNVGQGDCTIIELPYRKAVYVVDSGGVLRFQQEKWKQPAQAFEVGSKIVVPFLKGSGIRTIDTFILSHADADHVEGTEEVMKEIKVREVHISPGASHKEVMQDILKTARAQRIPIKERMAGYQWRIKDTKFSYLWPTDTTYEGNNDSLVLLVQKQHFRLLLTGDLEVEGERKLSERYGNLLAHLTVLKAGHHGSHTSSSEPFIRLTTPALTIFSAGLNNRYGHPHADILQRFQDMQLHYKITANEGTIMIRVQNDKMRIETSNEQSS